MGIPHNKALNKALTWIHEKFNPIGIIVTGSIIRGNPNANSDFDIYVIHQDNFRQRIQKYFDGIPCEIFVNNSKHIYDYLEQEHQENRPITAHMISTGSVLVGEDNAALKKLIQSAKEYLVKPAPLTDNQKINIRYGIATLFEDATDVKDTDTLTSTYFLNQVVSDVIDYIFLNNNISLPRPKERLNYLTMNYPDVGTLIANYFKAESFITKYNFAKILVGRSIGEYGFFEWDSGQDWSISR